MVHQLDYLFFVYGLAFILLGVQALKLAGRSEKGLRWNWLAAFGALHGGVEWLELAALDLGDSRVFGVVRVALMAASFAALLEFGRGSLGARSYRAPPWWVCLVLTGLALLGGIAGPNGLDASCRYALGLPGGLLAGWILWRTRTGMPSTGRRWSLGAAGLAFMLYAFATGLVVPTAGFSPASAFNQDAFLAAAGFPIEVLRTLLALVAVAGITCSGPRPVTDRSVGFRRELVGAAVVLLLSGGWLATEWRGRKADLQMREQILWQVTEIADTVSPEQVRTLSFTAADKAKPAFQRLREQLVLFGQAIQQRSIYTLAIRGDRIVFGPESLDESDPMASPPGTVYEQPTEQDWEGLRTGEPFTEGPCTEEYGTFVSGFAPVRDLRTGGVLMLVGLSIMAEDWRAQIAFQRLVPILFTFLLVVLLLAGEAILERRERTSIPGRGSRHVEAGLAAACGVVLTVAGALAAHDEENRSRWLMFSQLADAHATSLGRVLRDLRDLELGGLARFYEGSEVVSREEFHLYAGPLANDAAVRAFQWAPRIPANAREKVEALAQKDGVENFAVFQRGLDGQRVPAEGRDEFYPVLYAEPFAGNEAVLGFDLSSEPVQRAAIEEAVTTGLPVATDPVNLAHEGRPQKGLLVFRAVFEGSAPSAGDHASETPVGPPRGLVVAALRLQSALDKALAESNARDPIASVDLHQLKAGQAPLWLASWPKSHNDRHATLAIGPQSDLSAVFPLFACGRAYAITVLPGPAFLAAHPVRAGGQAGLIGLVLTAVVAGVVGFANHRRSALEHEVLRRTAELQGVHRATEAVQREEMRARALLEMSQLTITRPVSEVTDYALEVGIRLTGSKIGYIAFVNEDETVLTMSYWSKSAMTECAVIDKPIVYPLEKTGLWGEALRQRIPVITNDYEAPNPLKRGVPAGHVRVTRHMNIPVFDGQRIVAVVGVGNKEEDYNEDDVLQLTLLMDGMWRIMCRKRAEEALRDSEERHRVLYESSADAIMTLAPPSWRFTSTNPAAVKLFRAENEAQLLAVTPGAVSPERQPDGELSAAKAAEAIGTAMDAGSHFFEWRHKRLDGEEFAATVLLTRMNMGDRVFLQATVRDISERQRAEALEREKSSLTQAVVSMEHVLGVVGHELRTPLAGVRAMSEFLLLPDAQKTAEYNKFLRSINTEVVRMAEMVNDILEAARLSSGTAKWNWSAFRVIDACQDAIDTIRPLVDADAVTLSLDVDPRDVSMRGDRAAVWRLVTNLLRNAQKYTARGDIAVRTRFSYDQTGAWIDLCVQDTGEGMSAQIAEKLGEAFALNSGVVGDLCVKGSGLGLAICRGIIGAHGGSMEVHSTVGEGTAVIVRLRADLEAPVVDREPIQIVRNIHS